VSREEYLVESSKIRFFTFNRFSDDVQLLRVAYGYVFSATTEQNILNPFRSLIGESIESFNKVSIS
jgi:hypothetical protein